MNETPIVVEETEEDTTKTHNWKQYVKPAAFVLATVAIHVGVRYAINASIKESFTEATN